MPNVHLSLKSPTLWTPARVLVTRSAADTPHGAGIVARCESAGVADIDVLRGDRLPPLRAENDRATYALAKRTLAVVVAPPGKLKLQPIPPSADWRIDLAEGCPGPLPILLPGRLAVRAADHPGVRQPVRDSVRHGRLCRPRHRSPSSSPDRAGEGTTFEASCYTDPLALEHLTGSLSATIAHVGTNQWPTPVGLRFTTKFDDVAPLLDLTHHGRTRVRVSVNAAEIARRFEGGTARLPHRIAALGELARAGYRVGLTIAPIMPIAGWQESYRALLHDVAATLADVAGVDLTVECITHRFTASSKEVLQGWYPKTKLEMDEQSRTRKFGKYGSTKFVYPKETMGHMRSWFEAELAETLPAARTLYWT